MQFKETRPIMDTFVEITCLGPDKDTVLRAMDEAFSEIKRIETVFNRYDKESELSRLNASVGIQKVEISEELFGLIERSLYYSEISEGAFDITVAPLVDLWAGARKDESVPSDEIIEETLKKVGYKNILMDKDTSSISFLNDRVQIDLGAIAKGYAVDRAREILASRGIKNALINAGGNIFAMGTRPGKKSWRVGIQDPRDKDAIVFKTSLKDMAVATSGDYERFFMLDEKRFSHIINPLIGRPAEGVIAVTILARTAEVSDALSTAVFVLGPDKGLQLVKSLGSIEVFIFDTSGRLIRYP